MDTELSYQIFAAILSLQSYLQGFILYLCTTYLTLNLFEDSATWHKRFMRFEGESEKGLRSQEQHEKREEESVKKEIETTTNYSQI